MDAPKVLHLQVSQTVPASPLTPDDPRLAPEALGAAARSGGAGRVQERGDEPLQRVHEGRFVIGAPRARDPMEGEPVDHGDEPAGHSGRVGDSEGSQARGGGGLETRQDALDRLPEFGPSPDGEVCLELDHDLLPPGPDQLPDETPSELLTVELTGLQFGDQLIDRCQEIFGDLCHGGPDQLVDRGEEVPRRRRGHTRVCRDRTVTQALQTPFGHQVDRRVQQSLLPRASTRVMGLGSGGHEQQPVR